MFGGDDNRLSHSRNDPTELFRFKKGEVKSKAIYGWTLTVFT